MARREIFVTRERLKVAMSAGPSGMVAGFQFAASFQILLAGLNFQVALPHADTLIR